MEVSVHYPKILVHTDKTDAASSPVQTQRSSVSALSSCPDATPDEKAAYSKTSPAPFPHPALPLADVSPLQLLLPGCLIGSTAHADVPSEEKFEKEPATTKPAS